jgi:hypothetical protein
VDTTRNSEHILDDLRAATGSISGIIPQTPLKWTEGIRVRLEYKQEGLWLVIVPFVWAEKQADDAAWATAREFIRERRAARFNQSWNRLLEAWVKIITSGQSVTEVRAFATGAGNDAVFSIGSTTAFSRRGRAP